eukprot:scaffold4456_cov164-Amphora_coffeaeformis.AAC.5
MKAFFTKKQKHLMRERRKKKRMYEKKAAGEDNKNELPPTTTSKEEGDSSSRKRPHDALLVTTTTITTPASDNTIIIPEGLSAKEAKKFRKDARRQAKAEGRDESKLLFVSASEKEEPTNKRRKGSQQQSHFPNLNQLVAEQRKQQERKQAEKARLEAEQELSDEMKQRYVALDCEMVGVGSSGKQSALARASLTDWEGKVLMDSFVQVPTKVTDFRTQYSGVLPKHIQSRKAMTVEECRQQVTDLLRDKILVGHALKNDLQALMLTHPAVDTRDTAKYRPYQRLGGDGKYRPRKLRDLVAEHCDITIQRAGESHDSVDDARAAMELFKASRVAWEAALERKQRKQQKGSH